MNKKGFIHMTRKKQFEVQENESIDECLNRIMQEGYMPIRRIEKPIFKEIKQGNKVTYEPSGRHTVFEGIKNV
jgi:hypothetical protein